MKNRIVQKFLPVVFFFFCLSFGVLAQDLDPLQWPSLVGYWKFQDTSDLTKATVGNDLVLVGTHEWAPGAYYGDTAVSIAIGSYYKCYHQIPPNGGGDSVNRYTLMFDFMVHNFDMWHTFHQTDSTNMNDGECFIKPQSPGIKSTIGTATTGYTPDSISPGVWYRMVVSVCLDSFYRYYIDGDLWLEGNMQAADGRFALTPLLLFFADNNQEDDTIQVGSIAVFNNFLTEAEVGLLGGLDPCIANPPVVDLGADIITCSNNSVILDAGSGFVSYLWSTGQNSQIVIIDTALLGVGTSVISVEVLNIHNCIATDTIEITFIDCTSVPEEDHPVDLEVFPNPFADELFIDLPEGVHSVRLYNAAGQIIINKEINNGKQMLQIETTHLPKGIYSLIIEGRERSYSHKLIK